ncbi:hypothetical protein ACE34P_001529 [Vibrio fluvialis]
MLDLIALYTPLVDYLLSHGWAIDEQHSSENVLLLRNAELNETLELPSQVGLNHPRAEKTINEAISDLADIYGISVNEVVDHCKPSTDHIHIRAAGSAIKHGRINFRTNHKIESAIHSIIKNAAESFISVSRKRNKDKNKFSRSEALELYYNSVNTVVPASGSFIYNLDIELSKNNDEIENSGSLQRYVNGRLAKAINDLYSIENIEGISTASLIRKGLNESLCSNFINLFHGDVETIECTFEWSEAEPTPDIARNTLVFNREHKEKIRKLKDKFHSSRAIELKNAIAHLRRLDLKDEYALITLKTNIEGHLRTCDAEIDLEMAQGLMRALGEEIKQPVMINATVWIEKNASKHHYSLSDITSICSEKGKNLSLFSE